jgi:alpha-L-rhamnosidase
MQTGSTQAAIPAAPLAGGANVAAVDLRVDGREGDLLGIDNPQPTLGWQMVETPDASNHRCYRANDDYPCPGDQQTAYQIQVADAATGFDVGQLLWDSGKVESAYQTAVPYEGRELQSRQQVVWRVRLWDADGNPSEWSELSSWEMGLLEQSDWGDARWIDYPGRHENQPMPIFARAFDINKPVSQARLYLSGLGVQWATVNGESLTNEVLAPGYSNWQLSAEYRTYDITDALVDGSNTVGVMLGSGTAYVRRSVTGRTFEVPAFADFTLDLDVTVLNQAAGVFFRSDTSGNAYMWQLNNTNSNPRLRPHVRVDGTYTLLDEIPLGDVIGNDLSVPNHLTITAQGNQITTFINGIQVDTRTHTGHASGTIGFRTAGQESGRYDNVTVTQAGEVVFAEDFSGTNPFSGGTIIDSALQVSGGTDALLVTSTGPDTGRTNPYAWWQSQLKGSGTLVADAPAGSTNVQVSSVANYHVGGTINVDTGDGGDRLESRVITAIGTAGAGGTGISFTPALEQSHAVGALVTGSGNNIAASDPSAGAAVTPRMIGRLEVTYADGSTDLIVSDRAWRTAFGPYITDAWYAGSDYDARREQPGWDEPGADLSATATRRDGTEMGWIDAGFAPPPNLATKLVARDAPPVRIVEEFTPKSVTNPAPGVYVFDFGQNFAGWPQLNLTTPVPAGTVIRMSPAEGLANNGSGLINQASLGPGGRGTDMFNAYIAKGGGPETWRPHFQYFGMQFLEVRGLPADYPVTTDLITGLRLQGDTPIAGSVTTSNERINRIHRMAQYSFMSNTMTIFTDCPGREKQSYPADYTMVMGSIHSNQDLASYLRGHMRHFAEGQSMADTFMRGNVALKVPVHDVGFQGQFGDEINWGNGIILVPWFLYELYGDTDMANKYYDEMVLFHDYIVREKAGAGALPDHIVNAALGDWASAQQTSGQITGTWGYYIMTDRLAKLAEVTGHHDDAAKYAQLAEDIKAAFNASFYNSDLKLYATNGGTGGTTGATQVAQALALEARLAPDEDREAILDYLVENMRAFQSADGWPHFSGGTIGLQSVIRVLSEGGRDDVIWEALQSNSQPSYGFFMQPTNANPEGFTTIGEQWNRGSSRNHMILAQIDEWFHSGLAGIRKAEGSIAYRELVIQPKIVGDLTAVEGSYDAPQGKVKSSWTLDDGRFELAVTIPPNTTAEIRVPTQGDHSVNTPAGASFVRIDGDYAVYDVGSGSYRFVALDESWADLTDSLSKLAEAGAVSAEDYASLQEQIAVALDTATDGFPTAAANQLAAFVRAANDQINGEGNEAEKARLLAIANSLVAELRQAEEKRAPS